MNYIKTIAIVSGLIGIMYLVNLHDDAQLKAYTKYEDCVQKQYGVLPSTYYADNGTMPECQ